jgi:hypothetical protein
VAWAELRCTAFGSWRADIATPRRIDADDGQRLIELLADYTPDTVVGVVALSPSGAVIDVTAADVAAVDATLADDRRVEQLWLTGIGDSDTAVPALISWPCRCGTNVAVNERDGWPYVHVAHLSAARADRTLQQPTKRSALDAPGSRWWDLAPLATRDACHSPKRSPRSGWTAGFVPSRLASPEGERTESRVPAADTTAPGRVPALRSACGTAGVTGVKGRHRSGPPGCRRFAHRPAAVALAALAP